MTQRYHALDSLRGIIMWLGIVIHVAINHMVGETIIPWRDSQTGSIADMLVIFIHTFRMPVFFILSGFFGAMLLKKYGRDGMFANRAKRLMLPFVVFGPPVIVGISVLGQLLISKMNLGYAQLNIVAIFEQSARPVPDTVHLWFLYYLVLFFILAALVQPISRKISSTARVKCIALFSTLATRWWGLIFLTLPLVLAGIFCEYGLVSPSGSLVPNIWELIHNGTFFVFGWLFFLNRTSLAFHFQRFCWGYAISGGIIFFIVLIEFSMIPKGKMNEIYDRATIAFTYNFVSWLWSLSLIGMFLRYFQKPNTVLRYLSDSSYWVYLMHVFGTMGFGLLLYDTTLSLIPKMLANVMLTSVVCLISYHFLVRNTWIGLLLNGRKHLHPQNDNINDPVSYQKAD